MRKIESVQALRVFAMLSVVSCHMTFIRSGAFGVEIFFVISGFLMMYSTENGLHKYWSKKLVRIVPFYWIMTIFTAIAVYIMPNLFNSYEVAWSYLLKSLLFIPYEHNGIYQPVLGLGYTLNYEMYFYVLFYLSAKVSEKIGRERARGMICSIGIILLVALKVLNPPMPFYFWCNTLMLEFVFGIMLYYLFQKINMETRLHKDNQTGGIISGIFAIGIMVWLWMVVPTSQGTERLIVWGIPVTLLFAAAYIWGYGKVMPRPILHLASISYYIYLTHPYCVRLTEKIMNRVCGEGVLYFVLTILIGTLSSITFGYVSNRVYIKIEKSVGKVWNSLVMT